MLRQLAVVIVLTSLPLSGCMSTAQSKTAIGIGVVGVAVGTLMAVLADPERETGLIVAGGAIAGLSSGSLWIGAASVGPHARMDRLELAGIVVEDREDAALPEMSVSSPSPPLLPLPPLPPICWTEFSELDSRQQTLLLRERRDRDDTENEPYRMVLSLESCPEGYAHLRQASLSWQVCFNPALIPENEVCVESE